MTQTVFPATPRSFRLGSLHIVADVDLFYNVFIGTPEGTRTPNLHVRSVLLLQLSYGSIIFRAIDP